jgi:hypothetical protein
VAAEHHDDAARVPCRVGDGAHDGAEVARDEDVGKCVEEGAKRSVVRRRLREVARADLVLTYRDGNGADGREIGLGGGGGRDWLYCLALARAGTGRYDLRYRLRDPTFRPDFICSMM